MKIDLSSRDSAFFKPFHLQLFFYLIKEVVISAISFAIRFVSTINKTDKKGETG